MRRVLAGGVSAVVAAEAIAGDVGVIEVGRDPRIGCMAVVAIFATCNMRWVLARRYVAIVTGATGSEDLNVIYRISRRPDNVVVAVFADVGRRDVHRVLACRISTVMAVDATTRNVGVIEVGRNPRDAGMAVIAIVTAGYVVWVLASRCVAVMAGIAGSQYLRVIDREYRRPGGAAMAILASVRRADVRGVLPRSVSAVVTAEAIPGDVGVIEDRR